MIRIFNRVTPRITGIAVDIFLPTPQDGELYLLAQDLGVKFIFQCTAHKTIVGGNGPHAGVKQNKDPTVWCRGCRAEAYRFAFAKVFDPGVATSYRSHGQRNGSPNRGIRALKLDEEAKDESYLLKDIHGNLIKGSKQFDRFRDVKDPWANPSQTDEIFKRMETE